MIAVIATLGAVLGLLLLAEQLRRKKIIHGEVARKFVHIIVGTFIATWPYYLTMLTIEILCFMLLAGVIASRYFSVFKAVHQVNRKTWGDWLFPLGIGLSAVLSTEPWIFSAAVLHLSLADGAAALVGEHQKKSGRYKVFGHQKTVLGTAAFWLMSFMILFVLVVTHSDQLSLVALPILLGLTSIATFIENVAPSGADNILVPFVVVSALNSLVFFG